MSDAVADTIMQRFRFLEQLGFLAKETEGGEDKVRVDHVNEEADRNVTVTASYRHGPGFVIVSLGDLKDRGFPMNAWLEHHKKQYNTDHRLLDVNTQIKYLAGILETEGGGDLRDMLLGKKWERVPFNWGEYK